MSKEFTQKKINIYACIIIAIILVIGYFYDSKLLITMANVLFICGILLSEQTNKLIYLIFFVPWVYVLKLSVNQMSFYTVGLGIYIITSLFNIINNKKKISMKLIIAFIIFTVYICLSLFYSDSNIINGIKFIAMYLVAVIATVDYKSEHFEKYSISYAAGMLLSSLVGFFIKYIPNIAYYISYDTLISGSSIINRYTGLNWDPNYYGMQILISTSLLLVLFYYKKSKYLLLMVLSLLVCGLFSFSKMYFLLSIIMLIIFVGIQMKAGVIKGAKTLLVVLIFSLLIMSFNFDEIISIYSDRFNAGISGGVDTLTTGRSEIWLKYMNLFTRNFRIFLIGNGITRGFNIIKSAPHNLYICLIYWLGLVGSTIYVFFIKLLSDEIKNKKIIRNSINKLPLIIFLLSFSSLDGYIEEYFSIQIMLIIMALHYFSKKKFEI